MEVLAIPGEFHFKCQEAPVGIQSAAENVWLPLSGKSRKLNMMQYTSLTSLKFLLPGGTSSLEEVKRC
jgi:hypothetical protein